MNLSHSRLRSFAFALVLAPLVASQARSADKPVYLDEPTPNPAATVSRQFTASEKYKDGKQRVERGVLQMSDDEIINDGKYVEYYKNGKKFAEGNYVKGVYSGEWSFWYENGQLAKKVTFIAGRPDGAWEAFREDGKLMAKRGYKDGNREGEWTMYYDDGKTPKIVQTFVNGQLNGDRVTYYESGVKHQVAQFKDGVLHGTVTEWDESGNKTAEAKFENGKINGEVAQWGRSGSSKEDSVRKLEQIDNENASRQLGPIETPKPDKKDLRLLNH